MRIRIVVAAVLMAGVARGQGVTVSGTVRDSVAGAPLTGAIVQITADSANAMPRMGTTDSLGRYRIEGVPRGRYIISFLHPLLDSLTLEPVLQSLEVADLPLTVNLSTPAGPRLRNVFCRTSSGGAVVGVVRSPIDAQPQPGVLVVAEWLDLVIGRGGLTQQPASRSTTSNVDGWFALCGLPGPGAVSLQASRTADSTDRFEISIPSSFFVRRDLYFGSSRGDGALRGRVVNAHGGGLAGAIVTVAGRATRTDTYGEWSLSGLRLGTRTLDVRAIGYYPERRPVDVIPVPSFLRVQLATFESILDTMRISASVLRGADEGGFEQRRRASGSGRFLTEEDIRRRAPIDISDIFRAVSGVYNQDDTVLMRSAFGSFGGEGKCRPNVFLDGHSMPVLVTDLNGWLRPSDISSIEVYPDAPPPQFQVALSGCGSIVFWTKRRGGRGK